MNINPTNSDNVPQTTLPPTVKPPASGKDALRQFFVEEFRPERAKQIGEALANNPDVRPEIVDKAKQLIADPNYPDRAQLTRLAKMIVADQAGVPPQAEPPVKQPPMVEPPVTEPPVSAAD